MDTYLSKKDLERYSPTNLAILKKYFKLSETGNDLLWLIAINIFQKQKYMPTGTNMPVGTPEESMQNLPDPVAYFFQKTRNSMIKILIFKYRDSIYKDYKNYIDNLEFFYRQKVEAQQRADKLSRELAIIKDKKERGVRAKFGLSHDSEIGRLEKELGKLQETINKSKKRDEKMNELENFAESMYFDIVSANSNSLMDILHIDAKKYCIVDALNISHELIDHKNELIRSGVNIRINKNNWEKSLEWREYMANIMNEIVQRIKDDTVYIFIWKNFHTAANFRTNRTAHFSVWWPYQSNIEKEIDDLMVNAIYGYLRIFKKIVSVLSKDNYNWLPKRFRPAKMSLVFQGDSITSEFTLENRAVIIRDPPQKRPKE